MMPRVSVVMSVFNDAGYLRESINSILTQTFTDFEFIIVNDGSTDGTEEIVRSYNDKRIVYVSNVNNIKLAASLNKAIKMSKGQYIARMDADDISLPSRLQKQVDFLDGNPDYGVVGSWIQIFGERSGIGEYPESYRKIFYDFIFPDKTVAHPAVLIRKSVMTANNIFYDEDFDVAQDYKLWNDLKHYCKITNLQTVLLKYRVHGMSTTSTSRVSQLRKVQSVRMREFERYLSRKLKVYEEKVLLNGQFEDISIIQLLDILIRYIRFYSFKSFKKLLLSWLGKNSTYYTKLKCFFKKH